MKEFGETGSSPESHQKEIERLVLAESEAKLSRAELVFEGASERFAQFQNKKDSEHYGTNFATVLRDLACAYRLAHESTSAGDPQYKTDGTALILRIGLFCQKHDLTVHTEEISFSGLSTVKVRIE